MYTEIIMFGLGDEQLVFVDMPLSSSQMPKMENSR
jgi:hypothetical protein